MPHPFAYVLATLVLGLILTAYWGRVLRLVFKFRKTAGHDANFRPRESVGMVLRFIWYPAVVIWVAHPYAITFDRRGRLPSIMRPLVDNAVVAWIAVAVALLALLGTLVCWKRMGKSWRMGINPDERTELIVNGPYAYVRHPIYALSTVLMIASMVDAGFSIE